MKAPEQARRRSTRKYLHLVIMKSKLPIIATLATIACTGAPLQAEETEVLDRLYAIVGVAHAQCYVEKGLFTQEQADGTYRDSIKYYPERKDAFEWATTSPNGKAAVQALMPYVDDDCIPNGVNDEQFKELVGPYLK